MILYTTVTAGTTITAAWGNNVRDGIVSGFASAAARTSAVTSPIQGMVSYRADALALENYDGSNWTPTQANYVARTTRTSNSSAITTTETVVDSVTFTAVAGRRCRVHWMSSIQGNTSANNIEIRLRYAAGASVSSSGTLIGGTIHTTVATNASHPIHLCRTISGIAAGQTTIGALLIVTFGAGNTTSVASANYATELWIEDIGT
jgi:hypothetical protein